ncbi:hypothetical protein [Clostridium felsineum]|uniref:Uncharacterized protein n=1 Tax=Clostridium felsineum TaxID=36839 RepID=A0A1S8MG71_9CLOT|nr:hypothetical protein [Clostridium felsineum]URZ05302.1 hypothetical protein CLROS_006260 [Clostridium felsineum]URZ10343.1 hypothetical protein CROST_010510 [Clostridium felsineum]
MRNKIFRKLVEFYDIEKIDKGLMLTLYTIAYLIAKHTPVGKDWLPIVLELVMILGLIVQILREDRDKKKIMNYVLATLVMSLINSGIYFLNKYWNDKIMGSIVFVTIIWVAAIVVIIRVIFMMKTQRNMKKSKKIMLVIVVIYFIAIAIAVTILFWKDITYVFRN